MHRIALPIALIWICLLSQVSSPSQRLNSYVYRTGTKFVLTADFWGLSAVGTMEVLGSADLNGRETILVRSRVTKLGGLLGFIVKFLRIYKESNTFESYIDPDTFTTIEYEVYRLEEDGFRELTEHVLFDRERDRIVSLKDGETIINDAPPEIQDTFAIFLHLLHRFNTEQLFVGKRFQFTLYAYKKAYELEIEVVRFSLVNGKTVYIMKIERMPDVFKYPANVSFQVTDNGNGFMIPATGTCTIEIPVLPDVTVNAEITKIERATGF